MKKKTTINNANNLINKLKIGEKSKLVKSFDHKENLMKLHTKYVLHQNMDIENRLNDK
jgi:hypothetical protein